MAKKKEGERNERTGFSNLQDYCRLFVDGLMNAWMDGCVGIGTSVNGWMSKERQKCY